MFIVLLFLAFLFFSRGGGFGFPFIFFALILLLMMSRRGSHYRRGPYYGPGPQPYDQYSRQGGGCYSPGDARPYQETPSAPPQDPNHDNPYYGNPANPPAQGASTVRTAPPAGQEAARVNPLDNATGRLSAGEPTRRLSEPQAEQPRASQPDEPLQ